ncbi:MULTISPECIES: bifunctional lysylphosphatidylglycerol synthetase/lysine--tRNA ligase LysX [unclassified Kocuria]|uniref:bifunctional lysylphosphatidylglycerol synthetase/lysine--tRNA ligase LysX n=1 Tax=unclassified Kocuria TaxID=2649579 RepID=UPI000F88D725|nr:MULTISPECIES: bifunctional lysylphosphatidylglycerol synthetase/lysine--tRNA ligase LysX [unclassified Kocuria]RUP85287.1 bifunctional lysylphosphatidylglycerol synthetase/lysine--tRNA ligase LysX [Kocuria sp. HSID17590]RUQ13057.1 bifunctional lysylphosphatidylglycerol synthetase/lysine--tRNA ligase LysX [Kocuria sp. HSID17582]
MGNTQVVRGRRTRDVRTATARQERWARILIWIFALATAAGVVLLLLHWVTRVNPLPSILFGTLNLPVAPSLVSVVVLGLLTGALVRRKRIALVLVGTTQVVGVTWSVLMLVLRAVVPDLPHHGPFPVWVSPMLDAVAVAVGIAALGLLWWLRPAFPARTESRGALAALAMLVGGVVLTVAATHALLLATTSSAIDDWNVLGEALVRSLGWAGPRRRYLSTVPPWLPELTSALLALTIVLAVLIFLRSSSRSAAWRPEDEVAVRSLLREFGGEDSLGYFATRRDKSAVFSADGRACVTFRVVGQVSIASGDPVGDPAVWPDAIRRWLDRAHHYGLLPAVTSASERAARAYAEAGLSVLVMGDEAVLHPDRYSLANSSMTPVRRAVRRARRAGLVTEIARHQDFPPEELTRLGVLADQWRGDEPDRGFSMALNRWGDPADGQCLLVVARDEHGAEQGLLSFVPWGRGGLSLDVMRRAPHTPNGVTELMVTDLMEHCASHGIRRVSLNFAMFRGVFEDSEKLGAGVITRFNSSVLGYMDRFFQLESLYRSNAKYLPEWVPRYACFDGVLALPRMAVATAQVEGFLPAVFVRTPPQPELDAGTLEQILEIQHEPAPMRVLAPRRSQQTRHRMRHARALARDGVNPYPVGLAPAETVAHTQAARLRGDAASSSEVRTSGRVRRFRDFGGVGFVDLTDGGVTVQVLVDRARVDSTWSTIRRNLDVGDLLVVDGRWGNSRTGTESILARRVTVAAKALQPVPYSGFENPEQRLRRRSLDLLVHPHGMDLLRQRSQAVDTVRRLLQEEGYREVETPVLNTVHGGASARPFRTFINAYGMDLTLRIAPELYLKRLLVAGSGPIFEVARNFRNEGADATHNPEFTALEAYHPYADYTVMRQLTERLVKAVATALHGAPVLPLRDVHAPDAEPTPTDVSGPWPVVTVTDAVSRAVGREISIRTDFEVLLQAAAAHDVEIGPGMGPGAVLEALYEELVEPLTVFPTFYCDFPEETSPLTAPHRSEPGLVERWDLVVNGMELGTAYSELTDPVVQRHRLTEQSLKATAGDPEAMEVDDDFLDALEVGMPPAGGLGIGLDRLVMLMTATSIREVLGFPFVKPQKN